MNHVRALLLGLALAAASLTACASDAVSGEFVEEVTVEGVTVEAAIETTEPVSAAGGEVVASPTAEPVVPLTPLPEQTSPPIGSENSEGTNDAITEQPVSLVEEIEPMEVVQGGNVIQVYDSNEFPPELAGLVDATKADVAARLGRTADMVSLVAVAEVTWNDGSLGCPREGLAYAQVLTDGMRVVLQVDNLVFDYRASDVDAWFLCSQSVSADKSSAGVYEITEEGVVQVEPPVVDERTPTQGTNPPDE